MKWLYIIYLLLFITNAFGDDIPRVWNRIPQYNVNYRIVDFLNNNRINNCFEYIESPSHLRLKCWRDDSLFNVDLKINDYYENNNKIYFQIESYESITI